MPPTHIPTHLFRDAWPGARFQGSQQFYALAGAIDKTLKLYDGGYHDLLNDIDRQTVVRDIITWIEARVVRDRTARLNGLADAVARRYTQENP